jgi:hypothetical protein
VAKATVSAQGTIEQVCKGQYVRHNVWRSSISLTANELYGGEERKSRILDPYYLTHNGKILTLEGMQRT